MNDLTQQEILQILIQHAGETIAILDSHGVYEFINVEGARRFGMTPDQVRGKSVFDIYGEADAARRLYENSAALAHGQGVVIEAPHSRPDGLVRWYRANVQPLHDDKGNLTKVLVISTDITESRQTQEALTESQAITAVLLNASGDRAVLCDIGGTILATNQAASDSFGMSPQDMIGRNLWKLLPKDLAATRRSRLAPVLAGKSVSVEDERDGTILAGTVHPIPDSTGHITRMAIFGRDITRERRTMAALAQSEQRLRGIISSLHDTALVVYDRKGVCQSICIDSALDGVFGPKSKHCVGKSVFEVLPADAAARRIQHLHGPGVRCNHRSHAGRKRRGNRSRLFRVGHHQAQTCRRGASPGAQPVDDRPRTRAPRPFPRTS
jgi:PAS domain S-box-containing protein